METIHLTLGQHGPASLGYPIDTEHGRLTPTDADATDLRRGYSITTMTEDGHEVEVYPYAHPANPHSNSQETEPTIFDLFRRVQQHPDFVFGTIFVPGDFPNEQVPEDFPHNLANDALAERGNELIAEMEET